MKFLISNKRNKLKLIWSKMEIVMILLYCKYVKNVPIYARHDLSWEYFNCKYVYLEFKNIELNVITLLSSYISISIKKMFNYFLCRITRPVLFITGNDIMISNFLLQIKEIYGIVFFLPKGYSFIAEKG